MQVNSYRIYNTADGHRIDTNRNLHPDASEPILVQSTNDGWQRAELEGEVDHDSLAHGYGFWKDKQISHKEGWWWDRQEVIDRPLDGKIQPDEVNLAQPERLSDGLGGYSNTFYLGGEVANDGPDAFKLNENYLSWGPYAIIGPNQIATVNQEIADPSNWQVAKGA